MACFVQSKFEWCGVEEVGSGSFSYVKKNTKSKCRMVVFFIKIYKQVIFQHECIVSPVQSASGNRKALLHCAWHFHWWNSSVLVAYIMSKSSTSVIRKALKLRQQSESDKSLWCWEKLSGCGRTQIMNILKRKREILDDCENNASSSTSCYWKLYFCLSNIFIYLFVCFIQIISYWDNFINNKCKQQAQNNR